MKLEMTDAGLTQAALAPVLGVSQQAVSDRLRGKTPLTIAQMDAVSAFFGITVTELITGRMRTPGPEGGPGEGVHRVGIEPTTRWFMTTEDDMDLPDTLDRAA